MVFHTSWSQFIKQRAWRTAGLGMAMAVVADAKIMTASVAAKVVSCMLAMERQSAVLFGLVLCYVVSC